MKKREYVILALIIAVLFLSLASVIAENETESQTSASAVNLTGFEKSYDCLKSKLQEKQYAGLTAEELAFSILAMGYEGNIQAKLVDELEKQKSSSAECWPGSGCTLKTTAQVLLAYHHIGKNTDGIKNWLSNQTSAPSGISWYLQIDTNNKSKCTIKYDNSSKTIYVEDTKEITGSAGNCFTTSETYWLQVKPNCYGKEFDVSCDTDFLLSDYFQKGTGGTKFLTTTAQTAGPNSELSAVIESICFKQSGACNYEGSLWATIALGKRDSTIRNKALPYLLAFSKDSINEKYLPSAFLYALTTFSEYLQELSNAQNIKGYWQVSGSATGRYYDTGVALMSLYGQSSEQFDKAVEYLLEPSIQGSDGCWNGGNIRDTAFLLYAVSPKTAVSSGSLNPPSECEDPAFGYKCMFPTDCDNINGTQLLNFNCLGGFGKICCSKRAPSEPSCSSKGGIICSTDEECIGGTQESAEGTTSCCIDGECVYRQAQPTETSECEDVFYTCKSVCDTEAGESEMSLACADEFSVCCSSAEGGQGYWWVWLLVILIILIILGIIFRNQLKVFWFKVQSKFRKGPVTSQPPRQMAPSQAGMAMQRPAPGMLPPGMRRYPMPGAPGAAQKPGLAKERELDETMKKLREMGKK